MSSFAPLIPTVLGPVKRFDDGRQELTLRLANPADAPALDHLAQLDSAHVPGGTVLLAEVGTRVWAAVSVDDGAAVADPFRPTGELVALLHERARQLRRSRRYRTRSAARIPAARWPRRLHHSGSAPHAPASAPRSPRRGASRPAGGPGRSRRCGGRRGRGRPPRG